MEEAEFLVVAGERDVDGTGSKYLLNNFKCSEIYKYIYNKKILTIDLKIKLKRIIRSHFICKKIEAVEINIISTALM